MRAFHGLVKSLFSNENGLETLSSPFFKKLIGNGSESRMLNIVDSSLSTYCLKKYIGVLISVCSLKEGRIMSCLSEFY